MYAQVEWALPPLLWSTAPPSNLFHHSLPSSQFWAPWMPTYAIEMFDSSSGRYSLASGQRRDEVTATTTRAGGWENEHPHVCKQVVPTYANIMPKEVA